MFVPPFVYKYGAVVLVGVIIGGGAALKLDQGRIARLTADLATARQTALGERSAREAVTQMCEAGNAGLSTSADIQAAARRAIEESTRELTNATTADDADPLRAQFERLRQP